MPVNFSGNQFKINVPARTILDAELTKLGLLEADLIATGLFVHSAATGAPSVPTGVSATAGNNQVVVSWSLSTGATGYNVKRSTASGSEVTLAAGDNVSGTSFTDSTAVNGTLYYYVVSAINANGESSNSAEVSATPTNAVVLDNFTTAGILKTPQIGRNYIQQNTFMVSDGTKAFSMSPAHANTGADGSALVDTGLSDCIIKARIQAPAGGQSMGIAFRMDSAGDGIFVQCDYHHIVAVNFLSGYHITFNDSSVADTGTASGAYNIEVHLDGTNIDIFSDTTGTLTNVYHIATSQHQTATFHGPITGGNFLSWQVINNKALTPAYATLPAKNTVNNFIWDGNSITEGAALGWSLEAYPGQVMKQLGANYNHIQWFNLGYGGKPTTNLAADYNTNIAPLYDTAYKNNVYIPYEGSNELLTSDATTAYNKYKNLCLAARATGYKVVASTCANRGDSSYFTSQWPSYCSQIRANWTTFADYFVDVANDTRFQTPTNTTYYQGDTIHPNNAGQTALASLYYPYIKAVGATPQTQTANFTGTGPARLPNFSDGSKWFSSNSLGVLSSNTFTIPLSNKGNLEPSAMWHECNFADGTIVAGVTSSNDSGILFRYSDPLNMWVLMVYNGQQRIYKIQNGVMNIFHDMTLALNPDGSNIKVVMDGANVSIYVIDMTTPIYTFTDTFNQTATKHGLAGISNNFVPAYNSWVATPKSGASYTIESYNPLSYPFYTFIGNSLVCGVRSSGYAASIPTLVAGLFGNNVSYYNDGQSGADSSQILAAYNNRSGVLYDNAYPKGVAFVWELTNSLNNGGTAAQATADYQNLLLAVKASGWKTYAGTCLPRGTITSGSYNQTTFETARATCNTNLRNWWSGHIDGIVDFDTVAIGQPNAYNDNTLYYTDLIHLIDAGYSQAATLIYNTIKNA